MEMNPAADVLFHARVEIEDQQQFDGIWRYAGSDLRLVAYEGMAVPEGGNFTTVSRPQVDESAHSYFFGETDQGVEGIWAEIGPGDRTAILQTGIRMTAAGGDVTLRKIHDFEVAGNGIIFLKAEATIHSFSSSRLEAILKLKDSQLEVLAHTGGATPDGNTWSSFGEELAVSANGSRLAFSGVSFEGPVWTASIFSLWATDSEGQLTPVLVERQPVETTTGTFEPLRRIKVNPGGGSDGRPRAWSNAGELLFGGQLESNSFRRALYVAGRPPEPAKRYYWSGAAGDSNWHTRLGNGETNWKDETGQTIDPPGKFGTEIVHIEDRVEVVVDQEAIFVGEIHAGGIFNLIAEVDVSIAGDSVISALETRGELRIDGRLTIEDTSGQFLAASSLRVETDIKGEGELVVKNGTFNVGWFESSTRTVEITVPIILVNTSLRNDPLITLILSGGGRFEDSSLLQTEKSSIELADAEFKMTGAVKFSRDSSSGNRNQIRPVVRLAQAATMILTNGGTVTLDIPFFSSGTIEGSGTLFWNTDGEWNSGGEWNGGTFRRSSSGPLVVECSSIVGFLGSEENALVLGAKWIQRNGRVDQTGPLALDGGEIQLDYGASWVVGISDSTTIPHLLAIGSGNWFRNLGGSLEVINYSQSRAVLTFEPSFDNRGNVSLGGYSRYISGSDTFGSLDNVDVSFLGPVDQVQEERLIGGSWAVNRQSVMRMPDRIIHAIEWPANLRLDGEFPELNLASNAAVLAIGPGRTMQTGGDFQNSAAGTLSVEGKVDVEGDLQNDGRLESIMSEIESVIVPLSTTLSSNTPAFANGIRATTLINNGVLLPGGHHRPGVLPMDGDLLLNASGVVEIDLGGMQPYTEYDQVFVTGSVTLGGTLLIGDENGFVPEIGATFRVLEGATVTGQFDTILSRSAGRISFEVAYDAKGVTVTAKPWIARTYETWAAGMFTAEELADPTISGPNADPDGDFLINRLEYVMATNPHRRSNQPFQIRTKEAHGFGAVISFPWVRELEDMSYRLESSQDLRSWHERDMSLWDVRAEVRGEVEHISVRLTEPEVEAGRFYRLSARH